MTIIITIIINQNTIFILLLNYKHEINKEIYYYSNNTIVM